MLRLVTENKAAVKEVKGWVYHPEIKIGMNRIEKWLTKKAQEKGLTIVYSYNPIVFRIGLLLKLKGEKVTFVYKNVNGEEEVIVDDLGYYVNAPSHFLDMMEKIQDEIVDIRKERRYNNDR